MRRFAALFAVLALAACTTTPTTQTSLSADPTQGVTLSLLELQDPPGRVQDVFYAALGQEAFRHDIAWNPGLDGNVYVRGYLSVVGGRSGTLLIYVFDFIDQASGRRLLRVSDQVNSQTAPSDPWDIVDISFAASIWDAVLDEFEDWLAENGVGA